MSTYSSQPDGTAGVDTRLDNSNPTTNYGTNVQLGIGESNAGAFILRTLIKFDLSSIPATAYIASATLSLWTVNDESSNDRAVKVYRMLRSWTEAGATWNTYDGANNWPGGAGAFGSTDCEQTEIASTTVTSALAANTEVQWSLSTSAITEIVAGTFTNNGFLMKADSEVNDLYRYHSSDGATAGFRPKLVIEYFLGGSLIIWESD